VEQDPVVKSQRLTNTAGYWVASFEMDPWGGQTDRSGGEVWQQTRKYTTYERDANGSDEAMHRRYNRRWSKFDQPDPYDGSYNLTDPQSFNRYSYVQNDPVNFTDPMGLDLEAIINETVTVTDSYDAPLGAMFWRYLFFTPGGGGGEPTGTDPGGPDEPSNPQEPTKPSHDQLNDCQRFANIVAEIAARFPGDHHRDAGRFRDALWDRFNNRNRTGFDYNEFGSSGFKEEYRDETGPGNSPNQVYHYVGGFRAGYSLGTIVSGPILLNHETEYKKWYGIPYGIHPETPSHKADWALFKISSKHGEAIGGRGIKPRDLADRIRKEVCN